jgi:hypothetical protein
MFMTDSCLKPASSYLMLLRHKGNSSAEEINAKNRVSVHRQKIRLQQNEELLTQRV